MAVNCYLVQNNNAVVFCLREVIKNYPRKSKEEWKWSLNNDVCRTNFLVGRSIDEYLMRVSKARLLFNY
jgi:hypothetical protein